MAWHENGRGFTFDFQIWFFEDLNLLGQLLVVIPLIIAAILGIWLFVSWLTNERRSDIIALGGLVGFPAAFALLFIIGHTVVQLI